MDLPVASPVSVPAFTAALRCAGVPVEQLLASAVLHGHLNSPWLPQAQQSYADMAAWIVAVAESR